MEDVVVIWSEWETVKCLVALHQEMKELELKVLSDSAVTSTEKNTSEQVGRVGRVPLRSTSERGEISSVCEVKLSDFPPWSIVVFFIFCQYSVI